MKSNALLASQLLDPHTPWISGLVSELAIYGRKYVVSRGGVLTFMEAQNSVHEGERTQSVEAKMQCFLVSNPQYMESQNMEANTHLMQPCDCILADCLRTCLGT